MAEQKNYIGGSGKKIVFPNGGELLNMYLKKSDLASLKEDKNGYIKIVAAERREADDYGNTHSVYEDTFVPKKDTGAATGTKPSAKPAANPDEASDDLPF